VEGRVEAIDLVKVSATNEQARSRHRDDIASPIDCWMVSIESCIEVVRQAVLVNSHACVLHLAVGIEQLAACRGDFVVRLNFIHESVEPPGSRKRVIVQKDEVITVASLPRTCVTGVRKAQIGAVLDHRDVRTEPIERYVRVIL
jgi:hypothetical protein